MKKVDFDEYEGLQLLISKSAHQYKRSAQRWGEIVGFWHEVAPKHFGEEVTFEIVESSSRVDGIAAGQRFSIQSSMVVEPEGAALLAKLIVRDYLEGKDIELDRFLVRSNGAIASADGELLLERADDLYEYKLLSAIIRRVFGVTKA